MTWIGIVDCFTGERIAFPDTLVAISFDARRAVILATAEENRVKAQEARIRHQCGTSFEMPGSPEQADELIERHLGKTKRRIKRLKAAEAMLFHHDKRMFVHGIVRLNTWDEVMDFTKTGAAPTPELKDLAAKDDYSAGAVDIDVEHETGNENQEEA